MNIYEKILAIQNELKAPKGQYNSFGKYKYRSCEDILEAVKPLCAKHNAVLTVSDELVYMGDRYYIKATATLVDAEKGEQIQNTAFAREEETKKGMDGSQITGTASSYARKYALNGLFCIDDTKDADTDEFKNQITKATPKPEPKQEPKIDKKNIDIVKNLVSDYASLKQGNAEELLKYYLNKFNVKNIEDLTLSQGVVIGKELSTLIERSKKQ